jgi:hypothetical protein
MTSKKGLICDFWPHFLRSARTAVFLLVCNWCGFHAVASEVYETNIAPGIAIVTEVSTASPFVGQQVGVVFRLRVLEPPSAVDIDPQQFSGFWLETVPLKEAGARISADGKSQEYTLRRAVVFPLFGGRVSLPPLRVKIKRAPGSASVEWDVVGSSTQVPLNVHGLPPVSGSRGREVLVGLVSGKISEELRGGTPAVFLELSGTANIALFDPSAWLQRAVGRTVSARAVDYDSEVEPDSARGSVPALLMRRRWELRGSGRLLPSDADIPVFRPESGKIESVRIGFPAADAINLPPAAGSVSEPQAPGPRLPVALLAVLAVAALSVGGAVVYRFVARRYAAERHPAKAALQALRHVVDDDKRLHTAPRVYFESAQRAVVRCAREFTNISGVQEKAAECEAAIGRWRFSPAPPGAEDRAQVAALLRALVRECESGALPQGKAPASPSQAEGRMLQ